MTDGSGQVRIFNVKSAPAMSEALRESQRSRASAIVPATVSQPKNAKGNRATKVL